MPPLTLICGIGYNDAVKTAGFHLYNILLSLWVGGIFLFTFIATPVIFRSYGRDMAGEIVGRLFPSYFLFTLIVSSASLLVFLLLFSERSLTAYKASIFLLAAAVAVSLYVNTRLHPEIVNVKKDIKSFETTAPDDPLRKRFRTLHGQSAVLNLLMLADGAALVIISTGLRR